MLILVNLALEVLGHWREIRSINIETKETIYHNFCHHFTIQPAFLQRCSWPLQEDSPLGPKALAQLSSSPSSPPDKHLLRVTLLLHSFHHSPFKCPIDSSCLTQAKEKSLLLPPLLPNILPNCPEFSSLSPWLKPKPRGISDLPFLTTSNTFSLISKSYWLYVCTLKIHSKCGHLSISPAITLDQTSHLTWFTTKPSL